MAGIQGVFNSATGFIKNNAPTIITGTSIIGLVATAVLSAAATPKALDILLEHEEKIKPIDAVKLTWKCYAPAIVVGGLTIASMIWSNSISLTRTAALASVYSLSESKLKRYQKNLLDRVGPKQVRKLDDEIAAEKLHAHPVNEDEIINTGMGDTLCYDALSGRYFRSDIEVIKKALNKLSRDMLSEDFVTLNCIYDELGLRNSILGENIGWHVNDGLIEPKFSAQLTEQDKPCLVLDFYVEPRYYTS